MQHNNVDISPIEKIIAILSYLTMAFVGVIWIILAYFLKKKVRSFLMYNIVQSVTISLILAIFSLTVSIILPVIAMIPFVDIAAACINFIMSIKVLTIPILNLSFSIFQIFLYLLLFYIISGVIIGRIFYVPFLTDFIEKVMKTYR